MGTKDKEIEKLRRRIAGLEETLKIVTGFSGRIEKDLRQVFSIVSDTLPVPMLISLETGKLLFANGKAQEIFGFAEADIHDMTVWDLYADETDRTTFLKILADKGEVRDFSVNLKKTDGSLFPASLYSQGIVFDGRDCHLKVFYDLSELKQAEETLRFKEHIIRSAASVIATADLDGKMTYVNPSFLKTWGFDDPSEILGRPFPEFWMVEDRNDEIMSALWQKGVWSGEIRARRKDGSLFDVQVSANMVFDGKGEPISLMSTTVDITARKRAEAELGKYRLHLEEKVKERTAELTVAKAQADAANLAKSDFLARMSHEIRTPLNAVTGLTNIVLKTDLNTEQRDYLNKVQIAAGNLLTVINDILDFSKVEAGRLELSEAPFDLDQVLEQLADLFSNRMAQKDIELILEEAPQVPRQLIGDAARLTQVLTNLVANAVKFTESGEIVIGVDVEPANGDEKRSGRTTLSFRVSDSGVGIPAAVLPTLFDPFTQADTSLTREHEGTGLGLAICRRLVELMGGRIWAESTPGLGSSFSFTVVLGSQEAQRPRFSLPPDLRGLKTLVVDDSPTARQVLIDLLESFTFHVAAVASGQKALEALQKAAADEPYRLMLLDWKMPGMDGLETARRIHAMQFEVQAKTSDHVNRSLSPQPSAPNTQHPELSPQHPVLRTHPPPIIILVTAYGQKLVQARMETETAAVDGSLLKPVNPSRLFNTIMELFGREEVVAGRIQAKGPPHPAHLSGRRVLVVEDSDLNRDVAMALLTEAGLVVEAAENGKVAVDKVIAKPRGHYDAVLMDVQMPVMDGYQATRKIRAVEAQRRAAHEPPETKLPIIALTAHALKGEQEKCMAAGMDDYLAKPIDETQLQRVLLEWIPPHEEAVDTAAPSPIREASHTPPVLDVQSAIERLGGRRKLYLRLLHKFIPEFGGAREATGRLLQAGDRETAVRTAHTVKGAAASIGAGALADAARRLEQAINDQRPDMDACLERFGKALDAALASTADFVRKGGDE